MNEECKHGFVVCHAKGENRYLCKECNERFVRHPFAAITPPAVLRQQEADAERAREEAAAELRATAKELVGYIFPNDKNIQRKPLRLKNVSRTK